jgi:hypothetical protein
LALNHNGHGLGRNDLFTALRTLRDRGDIAFRKSASDQPIVLSDDELLSSLVPIDHDSRANAPYYALTPAGGARWEAAAEADWSRFFEGVSHDVDWPEDQRVLTAGSPARLRDLLDHHTGFLYEEVVAGSISEDIIRPFGATYWKTLSAGYRAHYRGNRSETSWTPRPPGWKAAYRVFMAWYRFTWHGGWGGLEPAPGARSGLCD